MRKSFLVKLSLNAVLAAVTFLPLVILSAREGGRGFRGGDSYRGYNRYGNYDQRRDQNYDYGGSGGYNGGYGGYGGYGGTINPYPDPESQPGMSDDSNALYQSYLRHNDQGY